MNIYIKFIDDNHLIIDELLKKDEPDYAFVVCVPSQKKVDFIDAIRQCLEYLGGVPSIIVPDHLKSAVTKTHRYEPEINNVLRDIGNHYHFVYFTMNRSERFTLKGESLRKNINFAAD